MDSLEEVGKDIEKDDCDYLLDYIFEKLEKSIDKYILKSSKISFTLDRCCIILEGILTKSEC